jgi:hypothetical protein
VIPLSAPFRTRARVLSLGASTACLELDRGAPRPVDVDLALLPPGVAVGATLVVATSHARVVRVETDGDAWIAIQDALRPALEGAWDPLRVAGRVEGEYDAYLEGVHGLVARGASEEAIAAHLGGIERVAMGLARSSPDRLARAAAALCAITPPPVFERVHAVTDFWDGPRGGVADFGARPHAFASRWDEGDDWDPALRLAPIDDATLALVLEDWAIWTRWEDAFHAGATSIDTHPALPADRARHEELAALLAPRLDVPADAELRAAAEFRVRPGAPWRGKGSAPLEVRWTRVGPR